MLILFDKSGSKGYAKYLVNRPEDSYTIIEGSRPSFEKRQNHLLDDLNLEKSHYRFVLSFDEENLDQNDMMEIYNDFKDHFFKSYDPQEYELFSVIHWDDNKPHIHMGLIANSLINDKELRVSRGNIDIPRIDAIAEILNYKHNLKSAKSSQNIFKKTNEQNIRDRRVKKHNIKYYEVPDDIFHYEFEKLAKNSKDFKEFMKKIQKKYPSSELYKDLNHIKEGTLKIDDKHSFTSVLFNETFFNKNKNIIDTENLQEFSIKSPRKTPKEYEEQFNKTNLAHKLDINSTSRQIHKGFIHHNQLIQDLENVTDLDTGELTELSQETIDSIIPNTLIALKKVKDFTNLTKEEDLMLKEAILVSRRYEAQLKNFKIPLDERTPITTLVPFNEKILNLTPTQVITELISRTLQKTNNKNESKIIERIINAQFKPFTQNTYTISKNNRSLKIIDKKTTQKLNQEKINPDTLTLFENIKTLSPKNKPELEKIKELTLKHLLKENITTKTELENFLKENQIELTKIGADYKIGKYITLKFKNKTFRIFNDFLHQAASQSTHDSNNQIQQFPNSNDALSSVIKEKIFEYIKPTTLQEFRLKDAPELNYKIHNLDAEFSTQDTNLSRTNKSEHEITFNNDKIHIRKSINPNQLAKKIIEDIKKNKWKNIRIQSDQFLEQQIIAMLQKEQENLTKNAQPDWIKNMKIFTSGINPISIQDNRIKEIIKEKKSITKNPEKQEQNLTQEYISDLKYAVEHTQYDNKKLDQSNKILEIIKTINPSSQEKTKEYKKLIQAAAKLNDPETFSQILNILDLKCEAALKSKKSKKEFALLSSKTNPKDKIFLQDPEVITQTKTNLDLAKQKQKELNILLMKNKYYTDKNLKTIETKQKILEKIYNKKFEKTPLLNYKITNLGTNKTKNKIIYQQNDSIIIDNNGTIEVKKSTNLEKTAQAVAQIAQANNYTSIHINGSSQFKALVNKNIAVTNIKAKTLK